MSKCFQASEATQLTFRKQLQRPLCFLQALASVVINNAMLFDNQQLLQVDAQKQYKANLL